MGFRPRSSHASCTQCVKHKALIAALGHHLLARKAQQELYYAHLRSQFDDRLEYWQCRGRERQRGCEISMIMDGMDQSKFSLPRSPLMKAKAFDTFQRPRLHVAALLCHGHFVLMSVADPDLKKDSNTCAEMLAHALQLLHDKRINLADCKLTLQADNTCREVKNAMLLRFLTAQVSCGRLHSAALSFLRTGHSHEDVDQLFGQLAQYLLRVRTAETADEVVQHVQAFLDTCPRPYEPKRYAVKLDATRDWMLHLKAAGVVCGVNQFVSEIQSISRFILSMQTFDASLLTQRCGN